MLKLTERLHAYINKYIEYVEESAKQEDPRIICAWRRGESRQSAGHISFPSLRVLRPALQPIAETKPQGSARISRK